MDTRKFGFLQSVVLAPLVIGSAALFTVGIGICWLMGMALGNKEWRMGDEH